MNRIGLAMTVVRRTILVVLVAILLAHYIQRWAQDLGQDRGINDPMKELQADGAVTEIPVGRTVLIDRDRFTADAVYVTQKQIMVTYTYHIKQAKHGWSFPATSLKLVMPDGQQLYGRSSGSHGTSWGERGYIFYGLPNQPADRATLVYDIYDRFAKIELPLAKAGEDA
ncbi:hypothetical protein [Cohnella zeiphila]|uniref:Uncharacterized protein n=1 Tax=Cohnella zeiphila TaxID=2761120 RepID=A0A7X0SIH2_9BACL|nr:hypothetical protein [Cohnella zeiphila]MBB6730577.1 hypothetical protein [Cohnella zeiphila]